MRFHGLITATRSVRFTSSLSEKCRPRPVVDGVGNMSLRDQGHRLGPGKGGALALAVVRRFMPCVQQIEALLRLATSARFARMHMDAIGATIDLRSAGLDQIDQRMV